MSKSFFKNFRLGMFLAMFFFFAISASFCIKYVLNKKKVYLPKGVHPQSTFIYLMVDFQWNALLGPFQLFQALCCNVPDGSSHGEPAPPEHSLCRGVFDAMVRFRAPVFFKFDRMHTMIFKDDTVYALDVYGMAKVSGCLNIFDYFYFIV